MNGAVNQGDEEMTHYGLNFIRTTLPSPRGGPNDFQLQYVWYTLPWNRLTDMPPLLYLGDTLYFYVDDPDHQLQAPTLDLKFNGGSPFPANEVFPLSGRFKHWVGGSGSGAGWFWPGEETFQIENRGLEIVFTVTLSDGGTNWFVDPEMNVEPPPPPPPHGGGKRARGRRV
jgi:hypothetical protein